MGEEHESEPVVQDSKIAAEHICNSVEYLHTLRPLGALWLTFIIATAYGVSEDENRKRIAEVMKIAYDPVFLSRSARSSYRGF